MVGEWLAAGRVAPEPMVTINELMVPFIKQFESYYVKNGQPTGEADTIKLAFRPLKRL